MDRINITRNIGAHIRYLRKNAGMTKTELSTRSGVDSSYINHIENGERSISLETLTKFAIGLDMTPSMILDFDFVPKVKYTYIICIRNHLFLLQTFCKLDTDQINSVRNCIEDGYEYSILTDNDKPIPFEMTEIWEYWYSIAEDIHNTLGIYVMIRTVDDVISVD